MTNPEITIKHFKERFRNYPITVIFGMIKKPEQIRMKDIDKYIDYKINFTLYINNLLYCYDSSIRRFSITQLIHINTRMDNERIEKLNLLSVDDILFFQGSEDVKRNDASVIGYNTINNITDDELINLLDSKVAFRYYNFSTIRVNNKKFGFQSNLSVIVRYDNDGNVYVTPNNINEMLELTTFEVNSLKMYNLLDKV